MPPIFLLLVKIAFLVILYLFVARAVRAVTLDVFGPRAERRRPKVQALASLVLVQGGQPIRTWPLATSEISIGRAEQSDVPLADPGVSRNHARVVREGDDFIVEDLRSTNGTEVNGQPIRRRRLANGDMLKLASSTLQFRREG